MPKSFLRLPAIIAFSVYTLYSCVFVALFHYFSSDFVLIDSLWFDAVDLFMQWVEIFGIALIFAFLVIGVHRYGASAARPLYFLLGGVLLYKYITAIVTISVVYGTFDITYDYSGYIVSYLVEIGCCALLIYLCDKYTKAHTARNKEIAHAAKTLQTDAVHLPDLLPFKKIFDSQNPIQRAVLTAVGVFTAVRLLAFVLSDIAYSMMGADFYVSDIPVMLIYLTLQIFIPCFIGYLLTLWTVNRATK